MFQAIRNYRNFKQTMKIKYLRGNQGKFMTKDLHKVIMKRCRLQNKFLRDRTETSRKEYKKQRNFCVNLLKKTEKVHFANLYANCFRQQKVLAKCQISFLKQS